MLISSCISNTSTSHTPCKNINLLSIVPELPAHAGQTLRLGKVYGCATALAIAEAAQKLDRCVLVLTASVAEAESLSEQLAFFLGENSAVALFPDLEILPYDAFSPHQDIISNRLKLLRQIDEGRPMTLLAAASTMLTSLV